MEHRLTPAGPPPVSDWHAVPLDRLAAALGSHPIAGLAGTEAQRRLQLHGPNAVEPPAPPRPWRIALRQLRSPLVYVLLAAAVLALALRHHTDAAFIAFVLVVNTAIGAWQEWHAEQQSQGLQRLLRVRATVIRDGRARDVDAVEIVPGDLVLLASGGIVPADARLVEHCDLVVDESLLTGESLPVAKEAAATIAADATLADRKNSVFAGTAVLRGRGRGLVTATGAASEIGRLAGAMATSPAGKPPLTERMERFSRTIAIVVLLASVVIAVVAVLVYGHAPFTMFAFGVALAVSAIPEGLPVAVTIALAIAARRMAFRGAIVRQLPAVEGLGSCSLVASDKTGTLTCNQLTARQLWLRDGSRWDVTGVGYRPVGEIRREDASASAVDDAGNRELLLEALRVALACNEARLPEQDDGVEATGDPTDLALLALGAKAGLDRATLLEARPLVAEVPYEPAQRHAVTVHRFGNRFWTAVKGAPEQVLEMCAVDASVHRHVLAEAERMAAGGHRVLALASGETATPGPLTGLRFVGLVGLIDPLREGAADAVARCGRAGIRVVMVTGDHPATAFAIASELGIAQSRAEVVTGAQLGEATGARLRELVAQARVFARVTPEQKLTIVGAAQAAGRFVAVTGDGVNDAPALHRANIGIAMGRGGTDVARQAADLVLSDDDFRTIVAGIEEGRIAYQNIRNVVYLLTAAGIGEVLTVGVAVLAGLPLPLLPVQLLWLNLVTNGIQDVGLAFERGRGDELERPPRPAREPIFDRLMLQRGVLAGVWMAVLGLGWFTYALEAGVPVEHARNSLLLLMVLMQNVDALNARSETVPVLRLRFRDNPLLVGGIAAALLLHVVAMHAGWLQRTIDVAPVSAREWIVLPLLAVSLFVAMETQKAWRRRAAPRNAR